jgi:hypothetical protein
MRKSFIECDTIEGCLEIINHAELKKKENIIIRKDFNECTYVDNRSNISQ